MCKPVRWTKRMMCCAISALLLWGVQGAFASPSADAKERWSVEQGVSELEALKAPFVEEGQLDDGIVSDVDASESSELDEPQPLAAKSLPAINSAVNANNALAILKAYDSDGYHMVSYEMNRGSDSFGSWLRGESSNAAALDTAVHEECHSYTFYKGNAASWNSMAIYVGSGKDIIVDENADVTIFPTSEMAEKMPSNLRTFRFDTYVSKGSDTSANVNGPFGLLNEFNAYSWGLHNQLSLFDYYRDYRPSRNMNAFFDFFNSGMNNRQAYSEFRYWTLRYLSYAKKNHPEVYAYFLGNRDFVNAFCTTQSRFEKMNDEFDARISDIIEIGQKEGHEVWVSDGMLYVDGPGRGVGTGDYDKMMAEIAKPEYQAIDKALHNAWSQGASTPTKTDLSKAKVTAAAQTYTGYALKPVVTVTLNGKALRAGTDYTVVYGYNTEVGTARIRVTGRGAYRGVATGSFEIVPQISMGECEITLQPDVYPYTGKSIKPKPQVTYGSETLKEGIDYILSYEDNVEVGDGYAIITGIGRFDDERYERFSIVEPDEPIDPSDTEDETERVAVYRLYNWRTSEHLWTTSLNEYLKLPTITKGDWRREGIAWYAPDGAGTPVYRLYNRAMGDHYYSMSQGEITALTTKYGWNLDNNGAPAFWSAGKADEGAIPLYCVYNSRLKKGQHHFTRSVAERDFLVANAGWRYEKEAFYGFVNEE